MGLRRRTQRLTRRPADGNDLPDDDRWSRNIHYHPDLVALAPGGRVLDVGCGDGLLCRRLAPLSGEVVGIDKDEQSIAESRRASSASNVSFIVGDALTHPFEPESFDLIVSVATLNHMDAATAFERFDWLLRPGGRLGIVGVTRFDYPLELPRHALATVATFTYRKATGRELWHHASPMCWPPPLTDRALSRVVRESLPGAKFRRTIQARHIITWTKPPD